MRPLTCPRSFECFEWFSKYILMTKYESIIVFVVHFQLDNENCIRNWADEKEKKTNLKQIQAH